MSNKNTTSSKTLTDLAGEIEAETDKTYLFNDGLKEVWLPKSLCDWDPDAKVMTLPEWLALERELI